VNDTTRLAAGAIGVAVVGSLLSAAYNHALSGGATATLPADAVVRAETSIASAARVTGASRRQNRRADPGARYRRIHRRCPHRAAHTSSRHATRGGRRLEVPAPSGCRHAPRRAGTARRRDDAGDASVSAVGSRSTTCESLTAMRSRSRRGDSGGSSRSLDRRDLRKRHRSRRTRAQITGLSP
jgi:hypothetical protein